MPEDIYQRHNVVRLLVVSLQVTELQVYVYIVRGDRLRMGPEYIFKAKTLLVTQNYNTRKMRLIESTL